MTTKTTHTPGPWSVTDGYIEGPVAGGMGYRPLIGAVYAHRGGSADRVPFEKEQVANARLIAAAPEMADTLKHLVEVAKQYNGDDADLSRWARALADTARALLARLEGV